MNELHHHRFHWCDVLLGMSIIALIITSLMLWQHSVRIDRLIEKVATNEARLHDLETQTTADATATRVLFLALVDNPKQPLEAVEVDVKKATGTQPISPALARLFDELRKRPVGKGGAEKGGRRSGAAKGRDKGR